MLSRCLAVLCVALLTGCATCREHPVTCAATVMVGGFIAAHELNEREPIPRSPRHGGFVRPHD